MPLESAERIYLERQVTLARVILIALALVALIDTAGASARRGAVLFLVCYLMVGLADVLIGRFLSEIGRAHV